MFTGIIKGMASISQITNQKEELKIQIEKPKTWSEFSHLKTGDSLAVNGVCLTLEKLLSQSMIFHLGYETLKITGWKKETLQNKKCNLEPALRVGDFLGGHFISGHVDGMAEVLNIKTKGTSRLMEIRVPKEFIDYFWKKSFIALNGVSLTINEIKENQLSLCLIPETLKRTNLRNQKPGDFLTFEVDLLSRALTANLNKRS